MNEFLIIVVSAIVLTAVALLLLANSEWGPGAAIRGRMGSSKRHRTEDALKYLLERALEGESPTVEAIAGNLGVSVNSAAELVAQLRERSYVETFGRKVSISQEGAQEAAHILRAHRLWEKFLAEHTGHSEAKWHALAERREHELSRQDADVLAASLGHPTHDPHGDPIPSSQGEVRPAEGLPMNMMEERTTGIVLHIEDEPQEVYARLVEAGFYPGMELYVVSSSENEIRYKTGGELHTIAVELGANVSVEMLPESPSAVTMSGRFLADLQLGETAEVVELVGRCRGPERRRLLDLGLIPGTRVKAELRSPSGDPTAYRVRGAVIALRRDQANLIAITEANT